MLGSIGLPELIILGLSALWAWAGWRIFQKAGYPDWIGLGVLVPPVAVVLVIFLAVADWPIEKPRPRGRLSGRSG